MTARIACLLCTLLAVAPPTLAGEGWLQWEQLPALPAPGPTDAFIGTSRGALIVAGGEVRGLELGEQARVWKQSVLVLPGSRSGGRREWRESAQLPVGMGAGAVVPTERGMLCLGGRDANGMSSAVFELIWQETTQELLVNSEYPPVPIASQDMAAARLGSRVYLAGGRDVHGDLDSFWVLETDERDDRSSQRWRRLPSWPGPPRSGAALVAQNDGERDSLFLIGGKYQSHELDDVYRFEPHNERWTRVANVPRPVAHAGAVTSGNAHVLIFSRSRTRDDQVVESSTQRRQHDGTVLAYNTITDTWASIGVMPEGVAGDAVVSLNDGWVVIGGEGPAGVGQPVHLVRPTSLKRSFGTLNFVAMGSYLLLMLGIGWYCSRRGGTTEDFFLAGRRIPWWAAGLSLMATQVSSIGFMAVPGKTFATNWLYFAGVATWFMVVPLATVVFIPYFRRLNITSAYEYLERRFNVGVRSAAAALYCAMQLARIAIVLYLPALALSTVIGLDLFWCVIVMGLIATGYTVAGGMEAVVWTDVAQVVLMLGGAVLCIVIILMNIEGGPAEFIAVAVADQKFRVFDLRWDYTLPVLWVVLTGNAATRVSDLVADQSIVQRYLCTPDVRQARRALWTNVAVSIPWAILVFLLGTALYVFYKQHPQLLNPTTDVNGIVPMFIADQVPAGLSGLIIAAIFAAAMSSFDSAVHSVATVITTDFYQRFVRSASQSASLWMARGVTLLLGLLGTCSALSIAAAGVRSVWDLFMELLGLGLGVLAGFFLLGALSRRGNASGALVGAAASVVILYFIRNHTQVSFFLYPAIGIVSCWGIGYVVSYLAPHRAQTRLTDTGVPASRVLEVDLFQE